MAEDIKIGSLPESVEEGTLMTWHKQEGDSVERDEKVADVETDKVVLEIASTEAGAIASINVQEGGTVKEGDIICTVEAGAKGSSKDDAEEDADEEDNEDSSDADQTSESEDSGDGDADAEPSDEGASDDDHKAAEEKESEEAPESTKKENGGEDTGEEDDYEDLQISPAAEKLLRDLKINARHIMGTGKGGRITKADVLRHSEADQASRQEEAEPAPPPERDVPQQDVNREAGSGISPRGERRVPMSRIRARIAERLVEAQQTCAILTTFNEVDMTEVNRLRKDYRDEFDENYGVRLGFMSFFTRAAVEALKQFPAVNASIEGKDIIYHDYYDIGMAISSPRGLVVPILRDADTMSFAAIESKIRDYADLAKQDKLNIEDLKGGTFTITNGGVFGSLLSTPILNPPQSGILGMHTIQERPMVVDGEIKIRPMMYVALSYDHRIIDGRQAVSFLVNLKSNLENPSRMLLGL